MSCGGEEADGSAAYIIGKVSVSCVTTRHAPSTNVRSALSSSAILCRTPRTMRHWTEAAAAAAAEAEAGEEDE